MTLAYLRGLIKPEYELGIKSRMREELMIQIASQQANAEYLIDWSRLDIDTLSVINPEHRQKTFASAMDSYIRGQALKQLQPYRRVDQIESVAPKSHSDEEMAHLFKILSRSRLYSKMDQTLAKHLKDQGITT